MTSNVDIVLIPDVLYYKPQTTPLEELPEFVAHLNVIKRRGCISRQDEDESGVTFLSIKWLVDSFEHGEMLSHVKYTNEKLGKMYFEAVSSHEALIDRDCGADELMSTKAVKTSFDTLLSGKYLLEDIKDNGSGSDIGHRCFLNVVSGNVVRNHPSDDRAPILGVVPITDKLAVCKYSCKSVLEDVRSEITKWKSLASLLDSEIKRRNRESLMDTCNE